MIKVRPSHSRLIKTETPDSIKMRMPPRGLLSGWGLMFLASLALTCGILWLLLPLKFQDGLELAMRLSFGVSFLLPGLAALVISLAKMRRAWELERNANELIFRKTGALRRHQRWPIADVGSLYVRANHGNDQGSTLYVGFRNGRYEELVTESEREEVEWTAAMMSDARGERKSTPTLMIAAEPERRKVDPAIVPSTLSCRTYDEGIEIAFLPLLRANGRWWKLPLIAMLSIIAIVGVSAAIYAATGGKFPPAVPRILIAAVAGLTGWRLWILNRSGVIQLQNGILTVEQSHVKPHAIFGMNEVEFVQTFQSGRHTELQFLLKDKPKVRVFEERPAPELEWAARFLRVAIKGRTAVPENAPMKVDAAAGDCQVCLERMDSRVVYCAQCRTPAHEECWSYMGMCSTYGCREIRFERA